MVGSVLRVSRRGPPGGVDLGAGESLGGGMGC